MSMGAVLRLHDVSQTIQDLKFGWKRMTDDAVDQLFEEIQREIACIIEEDIAQ